MVLAEAADETMTPAVAPPVRIFVREAFGGPSASAAGAAGR